MNSTWELVAHLNFPKNESCFAFLMPTEASVKGDYKLFYVKKKRVDFFQLRWIYIP